MPIKPPAPSASKGQILIRDLMPAGSPGTPQNMLLGSPPANQLTGAQGPGQAPPAAMPQGAPQGAVAPQQAPAGDQMAAAIAKHIQTLSPDQLAQEQQRAGYMVSVWGTLARQPNLTLKDIVSSAAHAVATGKATPEEAAAEVSGLPSDPKQLRAVINQRFKAAILSASLLQGASGPASPAVGQN